MRKPSLAGLFLVLLPAVAFAQAETIVLDHPASFGEKQRPPVVFPHAGHMGQGGAGCKACHHRYEKGANVLDESELAPGASQVRCAACHFRGAAVDLRQAFHRQCLSCHRAAVAQGKKSGPVTCAQCHPRAGRP